MKKILATLALGASLFAAQGTTLATVNGEDVTYEDIMLAMKAMPNVNYATLPEEQKDKVLDQVIKRKLLQQDILKTDIKKSKEYKEALAKIEGDLALEVWMQKEFKTIEISDKEAKDYYNTNKSRFVQSESVHARHILVKTEKEAKDLISELEKAKNVKDTFIELAKTKSTGPSGVNGGDLGFFTKEQMVPEFSNAAYALNVGQITKTPVKTQYGYHVIFLEEKRAAGTVDFAQVAPQIKQQLTIEKFNKSLEKKSDALMKKAKIKKL